MSIVVLIGAPGSGKSSVARHLAENGWAVWECDDAVAASLRVERAQAYLAEDGQRFAAQAVELAKERLAQAAAQLAESVGEAGGQKQVLVLSSEAVLDADLRAQLRQIGQAGGNVVHLDADLAALTKRLGFTAPGGLATLTPRALLGAMRRERLPLYQEAAGHNIDTSFLTAPEVARAVEEIAG
ncbi:MAG: shikimate kinase [Buchananella hordeovulneris]|nr:shikimate kinase [Buchananella hordeovulneris]